MRRWHTSYNTCLVRDIFIVFSAFVWTSKIYSNTLRTCVDVYFIENGEKICFQKNADTCTCRRSKPSMLMV